MATITLNSLHCVKLQDSVSEDEIEVRIGGIKVAGPIGVHKGGTVSLTATQPFTGSTSVQLVEIDGNHTPDNLGSVPVADTPVTDGNLVFDALKHAYYTVNYTVS